MAKTTVRGEQITDGTVDLTLDVKGVLPEANGGRGVRTTVTYTTSSIANLAEETGTVTMDKSYRILKITTDKACRVRVYATAAQRTADAARAIGTDPTGDHGLIFEFVATGATTGQVLSPAVDGFNNESSVASTIPLAIQNRSGSTGTVAVTFAFIKTES